jgi:hypothetical protein
MNGHRAKLIPTPEGRVVTYFHEWLDRIWNYSRDSYPPQEPIILEAIGYRIKREIVIAKIREARDCKNDTRKRMHAEALRELDESNGKGTPYEDCT